MRVIIYGPQGSGKSTQAKLLGKKLGVPVISAGEISRQIPEAKEFVDRGEPTPSEIINPVLEKALTDADVGYVLDGFPRYSNQLYLLEEWLGKTNTQIDRVILIDLPVSVSIERMRVRVSSENRADDNEEAIKTRLALFKEQTMPIIEHFKKQGKVFIIDGSPSIEEVQKSMNELFK